MTGKIKKGTCSDTMTLDEVAGYLDVSLATVVKLAREGKIDKRSRGRYDKRSVEAFAKERADLRHDTMTGDEVAGYLDVSLATVGNLAKEGKIDRRSRGRYDRKSVEAFAKERADLRRVSLDTATELAGQGKIDRRSKGHYDRKSVEAFAKERADLRDEVAGYLGVLLAMVENLARKIDRRSYGRYDSKSVEAFAKERADLRRDTMTGDEVAGYLDVSLATLARLAKEGKIDKRSYGRYDRKSVESLAKELADLRRDTMTLDEVAGFLGVSISWVEELARQGKIDRRSQRYDRKSVEAFADTGT